MAAVEDITAQTSPSVHGGPMASGDPQGIVLHHDGAGPQGEDGSIVWLSHWHQNPVSANQYIRRDGTIVQIVANTEIAWHSGASGWGGRSDCNEWCIGVEIANDGVGEAYTPEQYESVAETVAYNTALYHIPDHNVTSHARVAIPHGRKTDPLGWDWRRMWARVDDLRCEWPYDIPEWHEIPPRVTSTI